MTAAPTAQQHARQSTATAPSLTRVLFIVGAAMFIIAAFASGGHAIAGIPGWSWGFGALGAAMLAFAARTP